MKKKNYLKQKIKTVLLKRYALDYLFKTENKMILFLFSIINFILFILFFVYKMSNMKDKIPIIFYIGIIIIFCIPFIYSAWKKKNRKDIFDKNFFVFLLLIILSVLGIFGIINNLFFLGGMILLLAFYILAKTSKFIPKFVWLGVLGWILLTAEIIPGAFDYNYENKVNNPKYNSTEKNVVMDINQFIGKKIEFENISQVNSIEALVVSAFKTMNVYGDTKSINKNLPLLILLIFIFSLLFLFFLFYSGGAKINKKKFIYCNDRICSSIWRKTKFYLMKQKEKILIILLLLIILLSLYIFYHTGIYFIPLTLFIFLINVSIVYWEITDKGKNPFPIFRSLYFTVVSHILSANIGMVIYISISPILRCSNFTTKNLVVLIWIIIAGSGLSVFMALISQIIWSGKRLTDKLG